MKKILVLLFISLLSTNVYAMHKVAAVVNDEPITTLDIEKRMKLIQKSNNIPNDTRFVHSMKWRILESLVEEKLVNQDAKSKGILINETDVIRAKNAIAASNKLTLHQFMDRLHMLGIDVQEFEKQLRAQLLWSKIIKDYIEPAVSTSESELKNIKLYVAKNINKGETTGTRENKVKLGEILISYSDSTKKKAFEFAHQVRNQLIAGNDFAKLAKNFSQGVSAERGGDIGWFKFSQLSKIYQIAVTGLNIGEISSVIDTGESFVIIKLLANKDKESVNLNKPVTELVTGDDLKESLKQRKMNLQVRSYLNKLKQDAFIKIN